VRKRSDIGSPPGMPANCPRGIRCWSNGEERTRLGFGS
jgi:hypothetical protein